MRSIKKTNKLFVIYIHNQSKYLHICSEIEKKKKKIQKYSNYSKIFENRKIYQKNC